MKLGLCMEGNEAAFKLHLEEACQAHNPNVRFRYVEIGVAEGRTLAAACQILYDLTFPKGDWLATGIDIEGGWSFFLAAVTENLKPFTGHVDINISGSQTALSVWDGPIHFALIDGCHGKPCVMRDFKLIEPHVPHGGIVCFHDVNVECQGHHLQPHCQTGIDVRAALSELHLMDNGRPGWEFIEQTNAPHAIAFFQRVRLV